MPFDAPPTRTQERTASPDQSLLKRLRAYANGAKFVSVMAAMSAFLGAGSGTPHEEHQMQRDATSVYSTPEGRARAEAFDDRNAIIEATGNRVLPTIDQYNTTPHIERNKALADIQGFSEAGYSDQTIREVLSEILPPEWIEKTNISRIEFLQTTVAIPGAYGMHEGHVTGACTHSSTPGEPSIIQIYSAALEHAPSMRRSAIFLHTLLHEITHANAPDTSSTYRASQREADYAWLSRRTLAMQHGRPDTSNTNDISRFGTHAVNTYNAWTGDVYASPNAGAGYVNLSYPASIRNANRHKEANTISGETYAEGVSVVLILPIISRIPIPAHSTWEQRTALQLTATHAFHVNPSWRSSDDAFQDALEFVRFVKHVMPDIEERQAAVQRAVERLERESAGG